MGRAGVAGSEESARARERRAIAGRDAVDRALLNGMLGLLADEIQRVYWEAGQPCSDAMAQQIAADKIAGRIKLPPDLKPDHVQRCARCGRAHLMPLTDAEKLNPGHVGWQDPVARLCALAQTVVNGDYVALRELPLGDATNASTLIEVADAQRGQEATTGGGRRLPSGTPNEDGGGGGHQGTGSGGIAPAKKKRRRRVATGDTMEDVIDARFDYGRLDEPANDVRLRLSSTVVALGNRGAGVDVLYMCNGELTRAGAAHAIYTGYSAMLPYICADLGAAQRQAVADQVKGPLIYVNVALRSWRSWVNRGVHYVNNPAGFYSHIKLDYPVSLGDYRFPTNPDEPMILHLLHVPWPEGPIKDLRTAWRAGRRIAYTLPFDEFETRARDELTRILGPGGFDAQGLVTIPLVRLVRPIGQLRSQDLASVERAVCAWLGIAVPKEKAG